jgi:plastocyanin
MRAFAVGAAVLAVVVACGATTTGPETTRLEITMRGNSFGPRRAEVTLGDTVVWINRDIVRHNAVKPGIFESGELIGGESYQWIPADTGVLQYRCTIHQRMRGELRVLPKP